MPWHQESVMSQRLEFVHAVTHRAPGTSIRDVCRQFHIAEKTGHKWLNRHELGGPAALADRSHRPLTPAHHVPRTIIDALVAFREQHSDWGARKLRDALGRLQPQVAWPAPSTITTI